MYPVRARVPAVLHGMRFGNVVYSWTCCNGERSDCMSVAVRVTMAVGLLYADFDPWFAYILATWGSG